MIARRREIRARYARGRRRRRRASRSSRATATRSTTAGSPRCSSTPITRRLTRGEPDGRARGRVTSRRVRCGSRCTCSRSSPTPRAYVTGVSERPLPPRGDPAQRVGARRRAPSTASATALRELLGSPGMKDRRSPAGTGSSAGTWPAGCAPPAASRPSGSGVTTSPTRRGSPTRSRDVDTVIHVAGVNRAETDDEVEQGNVDLAERLAAALRASRPVHVVYANSMQADRDNAYGRGKRAAAEILAAARRGDPGRRASCPTSSASTAARPTTPSSRPSPTRSPPVASRRSPATARSRCCTRRTRPRR